MVKLIKKIIKQLYKFKLYFKKKVYLGKNVNYTFNSVFEGKNKINRNSTIDNCDIGFATYMGENCQFTNTLIGKYCSIANNVKTIIGTHPTNTFVSTHPAFFSIRKQAGFTYVKTQKFDEIKYINEKDNVSVIIGNDVWIGENVIILGGIEIGDGAIIGAGSIVTNDIEPYSINVGVPVKKIKSRFEESEIKFLKQLKWWNKSEKWIIEHVEEFEDIKKMKVNDDYEKNNNSNSSI